jgi:hypothetical protein
VSIPPNEYFTIDPSSNFLSKAHGVLASQELFFYVSDLGDLRVRAFEGQVSYVIAQGVRWASAITATSEVQLYYSDMGGNIFFIPYFHFGSGTLTPVAIGIGNSLTFDVQYLAQTDPPVYSMVVDDGIRHTLYSANDPGFTSIRGSSVIFNNALDSAHYVTRPRIAMHPQDTSEITVHCQTILVHTSASSTGFYVATVPGVAA